LSAKEIFVCFFSDEILLKRLSYSTDIVDELIKVSLRL